MVFKGAPRPLLHQLLIAGVLLLQYATAQAPESVMLADNVPAEVPAERPEFVLVPDSELASVPFVNASSLPKSASGQQLFKTFTFSGYQWFVPPTGIVILGPTTLNINNVVYPDANRAMTIKFAQIGNSWYGADVFTTAKLGFGTYQIWVSGDITRLDNNILFGMESLGQPTDGSVVGSTCKLDLKHGSPYNITFLGNAFYFVWPPRSQLPIPWVGMDSFRYSLAAPFQSTHRITWRSRSVTFSSYRGFRQLGDNSQQIRTWTYNGNTSQIPQQPANFHFLLYTNFGGGPYNKLPTTIQIRNFTYVAGPA